MYENPSAGKFERPPDLEKRFEPPPDAEAVRARRRRALLLFALMVVLSVPIPDSLFRGRGWLTFLTVVVMVTLSVLNFVVERKHADENGWEPYLQHTRITR